MKIKTMFLCLLIFYSSITLSDFNDGLDAYNQGDYDTAFEEWLPYAEQGEVEAQYNLALVYDAGYKDYQQATEWYRKAADQGHAKAQYNLALMYRDGEGVSQNHKEAIKWIKKSANQGHASAQANLGFAYQRDNRGVAKDYSKALYWTKKAAEQDSLVAQNNLAVMYEYGEGVTKDYKKSISWYLKAVDGNYEKAKENLNDLLVKMNGGLDPIYTKAVENYDNESYSKALPQFLWLALQDNVEAQTYLGFMYSKGQWVEVDFKQAIRWYREAADKGYMVAQHNLGINYNSGNGISKDYKEAVKWYRKAAKQGYKGSQYNLANMYRKGNGVSQSDKLAIKWYTKSAKQGHIKSQFGLGYLYDTSKSSMQDYNLAAMWYKKAADQGHALSQYNLALLYEYGNGVTKNINTALKWYQKAADQGDDDAKEKVKKLLERQESVNLKNADEQFSSGLDYLYGQNGVEKNKKIAFNWFYKSAKKGHMKAQRQIGFMYANGGGVVEDKKESIKWYRKSADQGYADAQTNLATAYRWGYGVDKDYSQALYWTKKAANQNDAKSLNNLALMYKYGLGDIIDKNYKKSIHYFLKSIGGKGETKAKNNLKKLLVEINYNSDPIYSDAVKEYNKKLYDKAFPKFLYLALEGNVKAQTYTGLMFDAGEWMEKDYNQALKWYKKAASQNYDIAQYNLALLYEYGRGVDKDIDQALKWYRKSADQGDKDAKDKVKKLLALQGQDGETNKYTVFSGSGTGFVVSKEGVVATNHHVIDNCGRIVVDERDARLILQDKINDLALIKVGKTYEKVSRLSYRSPTLGSDVSVFGYPLSDMMSEKHISLTKGSVSSLAGMGGNLSNFRFTAPVQPGNSGGPIINKEGKVVGITRAVLGKSVLEKGDFLPQNVNFGIRSSLLINMMESKMIPVNDTPLQVEDIVKHYIKTTKYIKCYE